MPPIAGLQLIWPKSLDVMRQQQGVGPHPGSRQRGFGAGMAAADDDDFVLLGKTHDAESTRFLGRARTLNSRGENHQGTIDARP